MPLTQIISFNITDSNQSSVAAGQPAGPEEQSMETNTSNDAAQTQKEKEMERCKEAKVRCLFTELEGDVLLSLLCILYTDG